MLSMELTLYWSMETCWFGTKDHPEVALIFIYASASFDLCLFIWLFPSNNMYYFKFSSIKKNQGQV